MRRGTTLVELTTALILVGLLTSVALPVGRGLADRMAVVAAREAVAGLLAEARTRALAHGGATVTLAAAPFRVWYRAADEPGAPVHLERDLGVTVVVGRPLPHHIRFDGLGLGRVASTTLRFRRGGAEAGLALSSYGRVRRW